MRPQIFQKCRIDSFECELQQAQSVKSRSNLNVLGVPI